MQQEQKRREVVVLTAIVAIGIIEGVALATGHNGESLRLALTAIAGLGGYVIGRRSRQKKEGDGA